MTGPTAKLPDIQHQSEPSNAKRLRIEVHEAEKEEDDFTPIRDIRKGISDLVINGKILIKQKFFSTSKTVFSFDLIGADGGIIRVHVYDQTARELWEQLKVSFGFKMTFSYLS